MSPNFLEKPLPGQVVANYDDCGQANIAQRVANRGLEPLTLIGSELKLTTVAFGHEPVEGSFALAVKEEDGFRPRHLEFFRQ